MKTLHATAALLTLTLSTIGSAKPTIIAGEIKVRDLKNTVSLQITGLDLAPKMFEFLTGVKSEISGDDGEYHISKQTKNIACGDNLSSDSTDSAIQWEDPDCVIEFTRQGVVSELNNDPFSWANAAQKAGPERVEVEFSTDVMTIRATRFETAGLIFEALTDLKKTSPSDDVFVKKGKNITCTDDESDGSEVTCKFAVNRKGEVL